MKHSGDRTNNLTQAVWCYSERDKIYSSHLVTVHRTKLDFRTFCLANATETGDNVPGKVSGSILPNTNWGWTLAEPEA